MPDGDATTAKPSAAASGTAEPGAATGAVTAEPKPQAVDFKTLKLDSPDVPEKFRGKTVAEIAKSYEEAEALAQAKSKLVTDWETWYLKTHNPDKAAEAAGATDGGGTGTEEQLFDKKQLDLLGGMLNKSLEPIMSALDNVFLDNIKSIVPDFPQFEARAREIYNSMPAQFKYSPKHGWSFAYNMAKSEAMGPVKGSAPPPVGGAGPTPPPTTEPALTETELAWAKRQGMTPEEYKKYQTPVEPK